MPELGTKFECFNCGVKFYDLGKPEAICPKCGANQKDAGARDQAVEHPAPRRRRKEEVVKRVDDEEEATVEEGEAVEVEAGEEVVAEEEEEVEELHEAE
jgi:uncharacterized protein (TIGR02300 family)